MFTGGLGTIGSIYDFITLPGQVREANILYDIRMKAAESRERANTSYNEQSQWRNVDDGESRIID